MFDEPALLLERTIHNLEVLAELFSDYVEEGRAHTDLPTPTAAAFQRAQYVIASMLPTLQEADTAWRQQMTVQPRMRAGCISCDD